MQLEIITPEVNIFEGEVDAVQFPGLDGSFQVLNNHTAIISALVKGEVKINLVKALDEEGTIDSHIKIDAVDKKIIRVDIKGGVVEMLNNKVIVLAE